MSTRKSKIKLLSEYALSDPLFDTSGYSMDKVTLSEIARISHLAKISACASQIVRRLGEDSTPKERTTDRKLSRSLAYSYMQIWQRAADQTGWDFDVPTISDMKPPADFNDLKRKAQKHDEARRAAAIVIWPLWWIENRDRLFGRRIGIATWAVRELQKIEDVSEFDISLDRMFLLVRTISDEVIFIEGALEKHLLREPA